MEGGCGLGRSRQVRNKGRPKCRRRREEDKKKTKTKQSNMKKEGRRITGRLGALFRSVFLFFCLPFGGALSLLYRESLTTCPAPF